MPFKEQLSFTGGEVSPYLHGRKDFGRFPSSVAKLRNMQVRPTGAALNRAGTDFIAGFTDTPPEGRLIPFIYSDSQAYVLHFHEVALGALAMWVLADGGRVLDGSSVPVEFPVNQGSVVDWTLTDIQSATFAQDGDSLILCHHSHPPLEIIRGANHYSWTIQNKSFTPQVAAPTGVYAARHKIATTSTKRLRIGFVFTVSGGTKYGAPSDEILMITDTLNTTTDKIYAQALLESLASLQARESSLMTGVTSVNGIYLLVNDVFTGGTFTGSADAIITAVIDSASSAGATMLFGTFLDNTVGVNGNYYTDTNTLEVWGPKAGGSWSFTDDGPRPRPLWQEFTYTTAAPSVSTAFKNFDYKIIAIGDKGGYSKPSNAAHAINDLGASWASNRISWTGVAGADRYAVYRSDSGGDYKLIGECKGTQFQDNNIAGGESITEEVANATFSSAGNYPSAIAFHQQRLVLAGTDNEPMTLWFSRTGDNGSFAKHSPTQADDAIKATIASGEINQITHLVSLDALIAYTPAGEFAIMGGGGIADAITPSSITIRPQGRFGSLGGRCRPIVQDGAILSAQAGGQAVRGMGYTFESDSFKSSEVSLLARHLLEESPVVEMAYCRRPDGILYALREDGKLASATLLQEQEVNAWGLLDYACGPVLSICSIPEGEGDSLYLLTKNNDNLNTTDNGGILLRQQQRNRPAADIDFLDACISGEVSADMQRNTYGVGIKDSTGGTWRVYAYNPSIAIGDVVKISGVIGFYTPVDAGEEQTHPLNDRIMKVKAKGFDGYGDYFNVKYWDGTAETDVPAVATITREYLSGGTIRKLISSITYNPGICAGRQCAVVADGAYLGEFTQGAISLPTPAARVSAGFRYQSLLETLPGQPDLPEGTRQASPKLRIRLKDSIGLEFRPTYAKAQWTTLRPRNVDSAYAQGAAPFSGVAEVTQSSTHEAYGSIQIRQRFPLPLAVLSITQEVNNGR